MSLQPLEWRKLPTRHLGYITSSFTPSIWLNVIYDMFTGSLYSDGSTRVIGSGSAWKNAFKFTTGSFTEAVCIFPPTETVMSQSIIFAGRSGTPSSSAVQPAMKDRGAWTLYPTDLGITCVKNAASQSFTQWTSLYPFGSASYCLGYTSWCDTLTTFPKNTTITIYESKEAIAIINYNIENTSTNAAIAGAIIDPEQNVTGSDAELDGRLYGVATSYSFSTGITSVFWTDDGAQSGGFLKHDANSNRSKFMTFVPQVNSTGSAVDAAKYTNDRYQYTTLSGKLADAPVYCTTQNNFTFLGRLRDMTITTNLPSNMVVRSSNSGSIFGYTLGASEAASNDTLLFKY
jgi:hypothetical protein